MSDSDDLSYNVRLWKTEVYEGEKVTTYTVRWRIEKKPHRKSHRSKAQAKAFRAELVRAQGRGEAFSISQGLPVSMLRTERPKESWYSFACRYVDHKWPDISAKHRGNIAFTLMMATTTLFTSDKGKPDGFLLRAALRKWAYSTTKRAEIPPDVEDTLNWVSRNTRMVSELADPKISAAAVKAATSTLDGKTLSVGSRQRNHSILKAALQFAVDEGLLDQNPIEDLKMNTSSRVIHQVDRRCVVNPTQARALLEAVRNYGYEERGKRQGQKSGPRLVAFFGTMYYSALRPEEAINLHKHNLSLPQPKWVTDGDGNGNESFAYEWGWLYLEEVTPDARPEFTDNGTSRDTRTQLKQREKGVTRPVPCPPELTRLLWEHMEQFGTDKKGRLFTGIEGKPLATVTYRRAWTRARENVLTEAEQMSPLAATPYALRHTCVSTWLNAGVSETLVAQWAGHSVSVLKRIYAKCLVGEEEQAMERISSALKRG